MKRTAKKKIGIYQFLEASGILESGTDDAIKEARKQYWRTYKSTWRRTKRREEKELTTSWAADEVKTLSEAALIHKISKTQFIKQATLAYINKAYIVPDRDAVLRIVQLLAMTYNTVEELKDENAISVQTGTAILKKIGDLERDVRVALHSPKTLEQLIRDTLHTNPDKKARLFQLLETVP